MTLAVEATNTVQSCDVDADFDIEVDLSAGLLEAVDYV